MRRSRQPSFVRLSTKPSLEPNRIRVPCQVVSAGIPPRPC
jgi:hypothetical protein